VSNISSSGGRRRNAGRLAGNVGWLTGSRLFRAGLGVVVLGAIGRHLGPAQFGELNFAIALTSLFAAFATLGFEGIVIRDLVRKPERTNAILGTAFALRFAGGIAAVVLAGAAGALFGHAQSPVLAVVVATAFLPGACDVIELWFQKNVDGRAIFLVRTVAAIVSAGIRFAMIWCDAPLIAFAWTQAIEAALGAVGLALAYHARGGGMLHWQAERTIAAGLLRDCWPLILSGLLTALYVRIEQLLVKLVLGDYALGIYYAAVRISETWLFVPAVIIATIYPALVAKRERGDPVGLQQRLQLMFDTLTGLGYALAISVTIAAPLLVPLIFGSAYQAAVPVLIIQAWTAPFLFSGAARAQYFLLENVTVYHTICALIGIATNIPLALWWMPHLGAAGAALAAFAASGIAGYATSYFFPKLRDCAHVQSKAFLVFARLPNLIKNLREVL
jgi:PST family polysaccharide transporter